MDPLGADQQQQQQQKQQQQDGQGSGGWGGSYLHRQADANLTRAVEEWSLASPYLQCDGTFAFKLSNQAAEQLASGFNESSVRGQTLVGLGLHLPCQ